MRLSSKGIFSLFLSFLEKVGQDLSVQLSHCMEILRCYVRVIKDKVLSLAVLEDMIEEEDVVYLSEGIWVVHEPHLVVHLLRVAITRPSVLSPVGFLVVSCLSFVQLRVTLLTTRLFILLLHGLVVCLFVLL